MVRGSSGARRGPRCYFLVVVSAAVVIITSSGADARHHSSANRIDRDESANRNTHAQEYSPPSASIVVDGNSGAVLQASNPDALRHPASLTKIMTLYLLFERLEAGRIRLNTPLKVSEHASEQAPTKLGLHAGQSITVEDAIKGMVTKSANDAAVAVAENLGGDEGNFAKLMTQRARALGMTRTTYMNASGLPDDNQVTTARDQALLGRTIQEHFPRYYKYFSTQSFVYHGEAMRNHNHLLGSVDGVDGIKTGFTRASGFNLVTSVHRGGRYLVAVVMGGYSSFERDAHMRDLISVHIKQASLRGTVRVVVQHDRHQSLASADVPPAAEPAEIRPAVTLQAAPEQSRSSAQLPALLSSDAPDQPSSASHPNAQVATRWPSTVEVFASVDSMPNTNPAVQATPAVSEPAREVEAEPAREVEAEPAREVGAKRAREVEAESHAGRRAHGGWSIQIGAFDGENEAKEHLFAARLKIRGALVVPITERVQRGHKTFYRARFAGFDKTGAETTCKQLKRSAFECIALQN
jgi:D-alanyl-D-alanine carboxypeptidase